MENKIKHLEMLQGIINRMAANSFTLKGWAVTLVTGIFALSGKSPDKMYFLVAFLPIIVFGALDGYYLSQERLYRALYDKVRNMKDCDIDFCMSTSLPELKKKRNTFWNSMMSPTVLCFYIPLAILSVGVLIVIHM